jgi:hypothetical protein
MLSWSKLRKWNGKIVSELAPRKPEVERKYADFKVELAERGISLETHIRDNILCGKPYVFAQNQFPYDVEAGVVHLVMWIDQNVGQISLEEAQKIAAENYHECEIVVYINSTTNQSVPSVLHYQVFLLQNILQFLDRSFSP